ncbi:MAG: S9 family peptidase [Gemmatimonadetes bacterium]|nr:S9 family peptidase [Gemmatimonadota bacterium]
MPRRPASPGFAPALLLSAMALLAHPLTAQEPLQPLDVFEFEYVQDPQISPDGRQVVYVRQFSDIMTDRNYTNLWIVAADGTGHRPLTTGDVADASPRWSPDGSRLAFVSDREGSAQIWVRYMDSGQMVRVTSLQHGPEGISWSPDGTQLAFTSLVERASTQIAQVPAPPDGATWAAPPTTIDDLIYRFNGPGYLTPGYTHVFVVPAEGGTARQISSGDFHHGGVFRASPPVWTPDGQHLILSANRRSDWQDEQLDTEIFEFRVADGAVRPLTSRYGPDVAPAISPDGRQIAYLGFDDEHQGYQVTQLHVMDRDGTGTRVLSGALDRSVSDPQWAPDGRGVYVQYDDRGNTKIALFTLAGAQRDVARDVGGGGSAYSGGSYDVGPRGGVAFTWSRPDIPGDVAYQAGPGQEPRLLTSVNADILAARRLGEVEEIWYPSSHDGRDIQGWIVKPPDFNPQRRYPLILEIHGGPFANYGDRFDFEKQMMAARGYVVLYTNPRGSTSYGGEFGNLIHHAYPGDDFYDLDSGVDAVIAKGYVDPDQVFVTGGSGGGVLTSWMVGRTDRFRRAVTVYPVINWYSFVLTADIGSRVMNYWFPGAPWDHPEHYESRSLLSVVKNVKTPTMVLTGEEDYRTPMSESEQYYQALKILGVESALVRVPGEPHGIRRRPSHWMAKIENILGWFGRGGRTAT